MKSDEIDGLKAEIRRLDAQVTKLRLIVEHELQTAEKAAKASLKAQSAIGMDERLSNARAKRIARLRAASE